MVTISEEPGSGRYPAVGTPEFRRRIGKELASAREAREMTVEQVGEITRINTSYLSDIEKGHWSFLPASYVKLFLKSFAMTVGLDSESFISRLDTLFNSISTSTETTRQMDKDQDDEWASTAPWFERNRSTLFYILVVAIPVIAFLLYSVFPNWFSSTTVPSEFPIDVEMAEVSVPVEPGHSATMPVDTTTIGQADVNITATAQTPASRLKPAGSIMNLRIIAQENCYVKITHQDSLLYEKTLWPGNLFNKNMPTPIKIILGNAPGVMIIADGDTLQPFPVNPKIRTIILGNSDAR